MNKLPPGSIIGGIPADPAAQRACGMANYQPAADAIRVAAECCGMMVWIGVKQQEAKAQHPEVPIWCPLCCAKLYARGEVASIGHLGGKSGKFTLSDGTKI